MIVVSNNLHAVVLAPKPARADPLRLKNTLAARAGSPAETALRAFV